MWILTWIVNWIPDSVFHSMVIFGAIGLSASFFMNFIPSIIPFVSPNKTIIQIASIALLLIGTWFEGFNSNNKIWEAKVKDLQNQVAVAEKKSTDLNAKIEYVYVDRIKIVKDTQEQITNNIKKDAVEIDRQCTIGNEVIDILNSSAKNSRKQ
jgi:hypothetical protein